MNAVVVVRPFPGPRGRAMGDTMADNCLLRKRGRRLGVFYHTVRVFRCGETESSKLEKEKKRRLNRRYVLDSYKLEGYLSSRSLQVGSDIGYSVIPPVLICSVVLPPFMPVHVPSHAFVDLLLRLKFGESTTSVQLRAHVCASKHCIIAWIQTRSHSNLP